MLYSKRNQKLKISETLVDIAFGLGIAGLFVLLMSLSSFAQNVGINTPTPHTKSLLDLNSSNKGLLAPRLTEAQRLAMFPITDPSAKGMLVYQTDNVQGFYYYDGTAWFTFTVSGYAWGTTGNNNIDTAINFLGTTSNTDLIIKTNSQEVSRIKSNGNFGLGTSSPIAKMHIKYNSYLGSQTLRLHEVGNDFARLGFHNDSTTKYWDVAGQPHSVDSLARFNIYNSGTGNLLSILGNGRIGIGNISPAAPLSFNNNLGNKINIYTGVNGDYGMGLQPALLQLYAGGATDDIAFGYGRSNAFTENVRFKGSGNVGINTATPLARLHVKSNSTTGTQIIRLHETGDDFARLGFHNDSTSKFWELAVQAHKVDSLSRINFYNSSSGNLVSILGNGRVGIENTNPTSPLSFSNAVGNKINFWNSANGECGIGIQNYLYQIYAAGSSDAIAFGYGRSNAFVENMRIEGSGNVGIGTTSPQAKVHIRSNSSTGFQQLKLHELGNDFSRIGFYNDSTTKFWELAAQINNVDSLSRINFFNSSSGNLITILGNGRMGIGNTNPTAPLSFSNNIGNKINIWTGAAGDYGIGLQSNLMQLYAGGSVDDIAFGYGRSSAFTEIMRVRGNGHVGIKTSTPTAELEVNGFTKLGSDAPAVKIKKITGNTAPTQGGTVFVNHGLDQSKILSVSILVLHTGGNYYGPDCTNGSASLYSYSVSATQIRITNSASSSANILNVPFKITVIYEE
ncbi:MAG: hypothetical protein RIQ89_1337 [Bacteroidota bacterium]